MAKRKIRNKETELKEKISKLEADAARWVVSLTTYLRITLFLKANMPYDVSSNLRKSLLQHGDHLDTFEATGYLHPELGYDVFKYLEKYKKKSEPLDKIFRTKMKEPPRGGSPLTYWRPKGAIGVENVAYQPWTTQQHAELLKSYKLGQKDKEVIAYHLRGPLDNDPDLLEGLEPIYQRILVLKTEYTFETGEEFKAHSHTEMLPTMIDLLNEYLASDSIIASSDVWLQREPKKKKLPPKRNF